jgi:Na+-transporting NADH:ubiquinone oxidoreductase subunit D
MGRLEAFSMANKPWRSFLDGIGNGLGYGVILVLIAVFRELFGKGSLFAGSGIEMMIIGPSSDYWVDTSTGFMSWYSNNNLMVLPAAAMFLIGIFIWIQRSRNPKLVDIS